MISSSSIDCPNQNPIGSTQNSNIWGVALTRCSLTKRESNYRILWSLLEEGGEMTGKIRKRMYGTMSSMGHQGRERTKNSNKFSFRLPPLVYHQPWDRSTQIKKAPGTFHRSSLSGNSSLSSGPRYPSSDWLGTRTRKMMNYSGLLQLLSTITRRRRVTWTMMREVVSTTREGEQIWRQRAVSTRPCNLPPSSCIIAAERPPLWQGQKERTS